MSQRKLRTRDSIKYTFYHSLEKTETYNETCEEFFLNKQLNRNDDRKIYMLGEKHSGFEYRGPPQNYQELRFHHLNNKTLFKDETFSPENITLTKLSEEVEWKRPFEITENPQFIVNGVSRFDVDQGKLGDCWFLVAVSDLTTNPYLFRLVVPLDQSLTENYAGIFHFRFWQYGRWIDVVIDDRLPTINGNLIYLKSNDKNEFWTPLLEKAYAKLYGSYKNIESGQISEALEDLCGGLSEYYEVGRPEIYEIMKMSYERSSLMGCSIVSSGLEFRPDGLISQHAYSITKIVSVPVEGTKRRLVRIRNPWGNRNEWNGAWSDDSECWNLVPDDIRQNLLHQKYDGEFWMEIEDFQKKFTFLDICHLNPSAFLYERGDHKRWNVTVFEGAWIPSVTAGGGIKYLNTFVNNPQYFILIKGDDSNRNYSIVVGLMQKNRRISGKNELPLELTVYKVNIKPGQILDKAFFESNEPVAHTSVVGCRQLTARFHLPVGKYCLVPSMTTPNVHASFLLRIYSESDGIIVENDENVEYIPGSVLDRPKSEISVVDNTFQRVFRRVAGEQSEIGWDRVQKVLNKLYGKKETSCFMAKSKEIFSKESCKNIVALWDSDYSGKISYKEFWKLSEDIAALKAIFTKFDVDKNGKLNGFELRTLLSECGYKVNRQILALIVHRYGFNGSIDFENFVLCAFKLKTMIEEFQRRKSMDNGNAINLNRDEWLQTTLYS